MDFAVHIDAGFLQTVVQPLVTFQRTASLRLMAQAIKDGVLERTDKGVDSQLQPFVPYAGLTLELKMHRGQRLDPPSLRDTGRMLDTIVLIGGRLLAPAGPEEQAKALKHQYGGVGDMGRPIPQRRFLDARPEDIAIGEQMIARAISTGTIEATDV